MQRRPVPWLALVLGITVMLTGAEFALRARYRHRVLPPSLADDAVRVVALGDSIVAGAPGEQAEAWPAQLERRLRTAYPHVRWHVVNAGISGDTAALGYQRFDGDVAGNRPAAVLIAFGLNDCYPGRYGLDLWLERQVPAGPARSYLWRAVMVRLQRLAGHLRRARPALSVEPDRRPFPRMSLPGFAQALAALVERTHVIGARPVLLTMTPLAETLTPEVEARRALYPAYNDAVRRMAARERCPLVELASGAPPDAFRPDGVHLTASGQAWVADEVYRQLDAQGLWVQLARNGGGR